MLPNHKYIYTQPLTIFLDTVRVSLSIFLDVFLAYF